MNSPSFVSGTPTSSGAPTTNWVNYTNQYEYPLMANLRDENSTRFRPIFEILSISMSRKFLITALSRFGGAGGPIHNPDFVNGIHNL